MSRDARIAAVAFMSLFSKSEAEKSKYSEVVFENDYDTILLNLHFAEKLFPGSAVMLCPRSHPGFKFISANCEHILGHRHQAMLDMDIADLFGLIHPDDLPYYRQCIEFIMNCEPLDPAAYRFLTNFRFRIANGEYIHVREEKVAIKTAAGNYLYLMVFNNITEDEKFFQVKLDVLRSIKGNFTKAYAYNPRQKDTAITPRQNDIAALITKGFSNQEIADQLNVSVFTVKNHKRILFRKINVKNSVELANRWSVLNFG